MVTDPAGERQIVRDDHGTAARALTCDGVRDPSLPLLVLPGRRLIEDEHRRLRRHGRRDGDETLRLRREVAGMDALEAR